MKQSVATVFMFVIFCFACHNSTQPLKKQIPPSRSQTNLSYQSVAQVWLANSKYFNLSNLPSSVDSFELRIWPMEAFKYDRDVFVFQKRLNWKGYHYYSYTIPIFNQDGINVRFKDRLGIGDSVFLVKETIPTCGWKLFEDTLHFFGLEKIQTQDSIPELKRQAIRDGDGYTVEIAMLSSYRLIHYSNPDSYSDSSDKKFDSFIRFVKRQLGNDYEWPKQIRRRAFPILDE